MTHSHKVQHFKDTEKVSVSLNMHAGNLKTSVRLLPIYQDTEIDRQMYTQWCCYLHILVHYKFISAITDTKYRLKPTFHFQLLLPSSTPVPNHLSDLMFIGPCIIVIVEEQKTNLMSLVILFHFLCTQHVSDINISITRSLLLNYHISRFVLGSLCVGDLVPLGLTDMVIQQHSRKLLIMDILMPETC